MIIRSCKDEKQCKKLCSVLKTIPTVAYREEEVIIAISLINQENNHLPNCTKLTQKVI